MMNIKPRAAGGYIVLLLIIIAVMAGHIVSSRYMPDVCFIDPWQLIAFELLLYVTVCYLWDRRSGALEAFLKALGMAAARLGLAAVTAVLDAEGVSYDVERKRVRKQGEERTFTHVHVEEQFPFELTLYPANQAHYVFKSSITGKAIERASIAAVPCTLWQRPVSLMPVSRCMARQSMAIGLV